MHPNATHANLLIYPAPQGNTHHWFITGCFSFRGGNIGKPIQSPPLFWFTSPSGQHNKLPDFPAGHSTLALIHLQRAKSISYWQVLAPQIFHNYGGASVGASRSLSRRPLNKSNVNRTSGHSRHSCAWTFQQRTLNFEPLSLKHCFHTTSIQRKHLWLPPIGPNGNCFHSTPLALFFHYIISEYNYNRVTALLRLLLSSPPSFVSTSAWRICLLYHTITINHTVISHQSEERRCCYRDVHSLHTSKTQISLICWHIKQWRLNTQLLHSSWSQMTSVKAQDSESHSIRAEAWYLLTENFRNSSYVSSYRSVLSSFGTACATIHVAQC